MPSIPTTAHICCQTSCPTAPSQPIYGRAPKSYGKLCRRRKAAGHDSEEARDRSFRGTRNRGPIQKHQYVPQNCLQFVNGVTHLDRLGVKTQPILLVGQEVLDVLALVALELDDLAHLGVAHDGAIAGKLLLDHFEDLLLVEFLGEALDGRQGFAAIALCGVLAAVYTSGDACV
jgi:hypothetical protein